MSAKSSWSEMLQGKGFYTLMRFSQVVPGHAAIVGRQEAFQVRPEVVRQLEEGLAKRCGGFHG